MGSAVISVELSFNINLPLRSGTEFPIQHQVLHHHGTDALEMAKWSARVEVQEEQPEQVGQDG